MSLVDDLGLDPERLRWQDLAFCNGAPPELFFEGYESDPAVAKQVDQICLHCPVMKNCARAAIDDGLTGVWGGIYWDSGKVDQARNAHKTEQVWDTIKRRVQQ